MAFQFAGRVLQEALGTNSKLLKNTPATVYLVGTNTLASLYTDRTKATPAANPTTTDDRGNLGFYAEPGFVDVVINGARLTMPVPVDPTEALSVVTADIADGAVTIPKLSFDPATQIELDAESAARAAVAASVADHLADPTDAHDASAVSFVPVGTIAATDVQTAVAEVATDAIAYTDAQLAAIYGAAHTWEEPQTFHTTTAENEAWQIFTKDAAAQGRLKPSSGVGVQLEDASGNAALYLSDAGFQLSSFLADWYGYWSVSDSGSFLETGGQFPAVDQHLFFDLSGGAYTQIDLTGVSTQVVPWFVLGDAGEANPRLAIKRHTNGGWELDTAGVARMVMDDNGPLTIYGPAASGLIENWRVAGEVIDRMSLNHTATQTYMSWSGGPTRTDAYAVIDLAGFLGAEMTLNSGTGVIDLAVQTAGSNITYVEATGGHAYFEAATPTSDWLVGEDPYIGSGAFPQPVGHFKISDSWNNKRRVDITAGGSMDIFGSGALFTPVLVVHGDPSIIADAAQFIGKTQWGTVAVPNRSYFNPDVGGGQADFFIQPTTTSNYADVTTHSSFSIVDLYHDASGSDAQLEADASGAHLDLYGPSAWVQINEATAPAAPSFDAVRIYAVDNGAGKTKLMALFRSGAAQQITIEP